MTNPLVKTLGMLGAIVVTFTVTFVGLFMSSRTKFVNILSVVPIKMSPTAKAEAVHKQFVYWNFHTTEINKMIKDLADQRDVLQKKQAELASQEASLASERKENERLRDEITRSRKELSDYIVEIKAGENARLQEQVGILVNMNPDSIVAIFNEKNDTEAVKLMAQMKPDFVAQILEAMMAQPAKPDVAVTPQKRAATLLDMLKRLREAKNGASAGK